MLSSGIFESALTTDKAAKPIARFADVMARRWLTRIDHEKVEKALKAYYADNVEYPSSLAPLLNLPKDKAPPKADRFDDPGGLMTEQIRVVVTDPALDIVQVGMAHPARQYAYQGLSRSGPRHRHIHRGQGHVFDWTRPGKLHRTHYAPPQRRNYSDYTALLPGEFYCKCYRNHL